jgi:hypothetical protein
MAMTANETNRLDGYRILRGAINVGDFIRIASGNATMRDQWWKVTAFSRATKPSQPDRVDLINAAGGERSAYPLQSWDKIIRHPYSQRRA